MAQQVTVTGATGFIASQLIQQLLEKGYTVNATVRSAAPDHPRTQHLRRLSEALPGEVVFFEADLLVPGAFDAAVKGSIYVFHVASPAVHTVADPQRDLIDPAVDGTKNVLSSVVKSRDTVRRVIVTSSLVACRNFRPDVPTPKNGWMLNEEDWNEGSTLDVDPYCLSKSLSEHAAWDWAKAEGIDMVTILPAHTIGPLLYGGDSFSPTFIKDAIEGPTPDIVCPLVDVRDIARAHVLAAEMPSATGRYLVCPPQPFTSSWLRQVLGARFPEFDLPPFKAPTPQFTVDNSKVIRELGLVFRPLSETVIDTAVSLIKLGLVTPKLK